jgi:hypothetical protein
MKQYYTYCRECKAEIVFIRNKEGKNIPVNKSYLNIEERRSLAMGLIIPYEALSMQKHFDTCPKNRDQRKSTNYMRY